MVVLFTTVLIVHVYFNSDVEWKSGSEIEEEKFTENLQNFSKSEQNILLKKKNKEKKAMEKKKMKGDTRFFQVKNTAGLKSGGKVGKFKTSGVLSLTRSDVRNMK